MTSQPRSQYGREEPDKARSLRRSATDAEVSLWLWLRERAVVGTKFRRQHPVGRYILDFYSHERRLAIEVEGRQHYEDQVLAEDARRTAFLDAQGIEVLRFTNIDVLLNLEGVMTVVLQTLGEPSPNPLPEGEG